MKKTNSKFETPDIGCEYTYWGQSELIAELKKRDAEQSEDNEITYNISQEKKPLHYGDYANKDDDELIEMRENLMNYIETKKTQEFIDKFHELLEVERELTLREDR